MEAPLTRLAYLAIRSAPVQRVLHLHGFEVQRVLVGPLLVLLLKGGRPARLLTRDSKDRDPYLTLVRCHQLAGEDLIGLSKCSNVDVALARSRGCQQGSLPLCSGPNKVVAILGALWLCTR
eukprot:1138427-Pelagomonas_calceolata.AAC.2